MTNKQEALIDKTRISLMLTAYSQKYDVSFRTMSKEIGFSPATLTRFIQGKEIDQTNFLKFLNWMIKNEQ